MEQAVSARRRALAVVFWLAAANCGALWLLELGLLRYAAAPSALSGVHLSLAFLSHLALLVLLLTLPLAAAAAALPRRRLVLWLPAALWGPLLLFFYVDQMVFVRYKMHLNGTILSFLTTPGLRDNLALSASMYVKAGLLVAVAGGLEHLAARWLWRLAERKPAVAERLGRHAAAAGALLLAAALVEKPLYAAADIAGRRDVLLNAEVLPFYLPATCKRLAAALGVRPERVRRFDRDSMLRYPLRPVPLPESPRKLNVLWIAVEQWRSDAFTPQVAPNLWRFSRRCLVGRRHYSSGNTTRYGIFGMFYGLHGFYWESFLAARQPPVFLDLLRAMGYQMLAMGSANFDNPELNLTCFAGLREGEVVSGFPEHGAAGDAAMTARFGEFLDRRDPQRPFFAFLFLDGPHSYTFLDPPGFTPPFPSGCGRTVDYEKAGRDPAYARHLKARYLNSLAFSDFLLGRVLADLERRGLLESTVVMIAGDHGEEFGESGRFGHNSAFNDWQTRTMFLMWYPGCRPGGLDKMTSHLDWAPTALGLLGVRVPPGDYCQGLDVLGPEERDQAFCASWTCAAVITAEGGRMVFPMKYYRLSTLEVCDGRGRPLPDREGFLKRHGGKLREALESARRFRR